MNFLVKLFGSRNDNYLKSIKPWLNRINEIEPTYKAMDDATLKNQTILLKERFNNGEPLLTMLPEAFATCREAAFRVLNQRHFDVQILGGIALFQGNIAEMRTGEGKTLTATLPSYLHALSGKGAHVVTVNDYLARRDAEWMAKVFNALGMSVGIIVHGLTDQERKENYACDVTYGTNNEFGFDFLRDNMKTELHRLVQRGHNFAIVDEVDSILIDEARTPLIISGPTEGDLELYKKVNAVIPGIQKDIDYILDEKSRSVTLTEDGMSKMEKRLRIDNLFEPKNVHWLHHIQQAVKAHVIFKKDVDYVVRNGEVLIVDEFTGRLMPGRRYSDGLHGALEAKEHVTVQQETQTLATITFQNYFRLYGTLSGMTGTADTEAVEFKKIYNLNVVVIPTNRKLVRIDAEDMIYRTASEKYNAIAHEIKEASEKGQPVLVGTVSVEKSELLSNLLNKLKIPHEVLNAKNHEREANIIKEAGQRAHVTIATNMAGRGTDIILGSDVRELGGLYVIGTERHESRRIDNQLRGRSGRQGDPGKSKFFLSLEDDLMRIFASDRLSGIMAKLGMEEGEAIVSPMVTRAIERAQKRVEEQNFSSRKNLLEYDDVMNQQRQVIYKKRLEALQQEEGAYFLPHSVERTVRQVLMRHSPEALHQELWDYTGIHNELAGIFRTEGLLPATDRFSADMSIETILEIYTSAILDHYEKKKTLVGPENMKKVECFFYLQVIDHIWKDHLLAMDSLKDSVMLRGYGQRDPLQEYKKEAFQLFFGVIEKIEDELSTALVNIMPPAPEDLRPEAPPAASLEHVVEQAAKEEAAAIEKKNENLIYRGSNSNANTKKSTSPVTFKRPDDKVGRNDICPCGSGKKFKKCHGLV